ncbi:MAG: hypothetical protein ABSG98_12935 [Anaerolineales bacterium]|jgi:hypothetical protein
MSWPVECHSGYEYAERPEAFHWEGQWLQIEAIEGEWRVPDGKRFRVRTQGGRIFELLYAERHDEWRVQPR